MYFSLLFLAFFLLVSQGHQCYDLKHSRQCIPCCYKEVWLKSILKAMHWISKVKTASIEIPHYDGCDLCPNSPLIWGFYSTLLLLYEEILQRYSYLSIYLVCIPLSRLEYSVLMAPGSRRCHTAVPATQHFTLKTIKICIWWWKKHSGFLLSDIVSNRIQLSRSA